MGSLAVSRSRRPLSWGEVERILRTYAAMSPRPGLISYGIRGEGVQRGAHTSDLWRATVATKLERDPNRVLPHRWALELELPVRGIRSRMRTGHFGTLKSMLKPRGTRINVAGLWAQVDATLANLEVVVADLERRNAQSDGQLRELMLEARNTCLGWLDITMWLRGHYAYKRSMDWLATEFGRCAGAEPGFLRHIDVDL